MHIALKAAEMINAKGKATRVVSMPSWELFEAQPADYRRQILPTEVRAKIAIEAGSPQGWHRFVGSAGRVVALDHFGASAPAQTLFEKFGLTAERVVENALETV